MVRTRCGGGGAALPRRAAGRAAAPAPAPCTGARSSTGTGAPPRRRRAILPPRRADAARRDGPWARRSARRCRTGSRPTPRRISCTTRSCSRARCPGRLLPQKKHAYATSMQKRGFSTEGRARRRSVADVVAGEAKLARGGEDRQIHLSVTRMQAIFAEKPEVHRLFLAKVPHEMSEKAFWTAYLRKQEKKKLEQQAKAEAALERQSAPARDAAAGAASSTYTSSARGARRTTPRAGSGSGTRRERRPRGGRGSSATRAASASSSTTTSRTTSASPTARAPRSGAGRAI